MFSEREHNLRVLEDHVLSGEQAADREHSVRAERTMMMSQATFRDAFASIPGLTENVVTALVTTQIQNEVRRADISLHAVLQGLVDKTLHEELNSAEFENRLFRQMEGGALSRSRGKKMTEVMLDKQGLIPSLAAISKNENKKTVIVKLERESRLQKFIKVSYSKGERLASPIDWHPTDTSDERKSEKSSIDTSEQQALCLPPCNDVTAGNKSRQYIRTEERKLDVSSLRIVELVNKCILGTVADRNNRLLERSSRYNDDVAHK